jgi:hypothetical protein
MSLGTTDDSWWCYEVLGLPLSSVACANYRSQQQDRAEYEAELSRLRAEESTSDQAAAEAGAGIADAQANAARNTTRNLGWAALPVVGAVVMVVGVIGGYLWWRRQPTTSEQLPLAQLSDDELERLIYERQIEGGMSGVTGLLTP